MNRFWLLLLMPVLLAGCGGGDSSGSASGSGNGKTAKVSFSVSDAPVDSAKEVVVAFDKIELVRDGQANIVLDIKQGTKVDGTTVVDGYDQVDLLKFQGTDSKTILSDQEVPVGKYKNLILHVIDEDTNFSWVIDDTNSQERVELKQPSEKLKLGGFEVTSEAVQLFTLEFDLRRSLVKNKNGNNSDRYNLKPHGVSIVANESAASLSGTVDTALFDAGTCPADSGNVVYLYPGIGLDQTKLVDNGVPDDKDFNSASPLPTGSVLPVASVQVDADTNPVDPNKQAYSFGFLEAGAYTVAFSCDAGSDDPVQYDGIVIPNPADLKPQEVILAKGGKGSVDFTQ